MTLLRSSNRSSSGGRSVASKTGPDATGSQDSCLKAALDYARGCLGVIPLYAPKDTGCSCPLGPACGSPGKHPLTKNGLKEASMDDGVIRGWWKRWPAANVGILTGRQSGLVVLDVDPRHGGDKSVETLNLPVTVEAITGGGGRHLLFAYPAGQEVGNRTGVLPGIDVRGNDGYIVAPPSRHKSGNHYRWHPELDLHHKMADLPLGLIEMLSRPHVSPGCPTNGTGGAIPEGQRNATLASIAGSMRHHGMIESEILVALLSVNERRCRPPLPEQEVARIATSICRYEAAAPAASELAPTPILEVISIDDEAAWAALPDETFYVPEIIALNQIAFVVAEPKAGKSLLTLDLAWALAQDRGATWPFGRPESNNQSPAVTGAKVLFLALEDARSTVKVRRQQFLVAYGGTNDRLRIAFVRSRPFLLYEPRDIDELRSHLDDGFNVIVLDTLGASSGGKGDTKREDWAEVIEPHLRMIRDRPTTLIIVEHVRKDSGAESRAKARAKRGRIEKPDPHGLFGSVAKRALYASALYLGDTPWPRRFSVYVESKVSDAAPWFLVERAPMHESPGWRHRYVGEVATAQQELAAKSKEEGERNYQDVLVALQDGPLTYAEITAKTGHCRSTVQGHVQSAMARGRVVDAGKRGRALLFAVVNAPSAEGTAEAIVNASADQSHVL